MFESIPAAKSLLPVKQRQMYLIYKKLNAAGTFVLSDEKGNAIVSPYYTDLQSQLVEQAQKERFFVEEMTFTEFVLQESNK